MSNPDGIMIEQRLAALPELEGDKLEFIWDLDFVDNVKPFVILKLGGQEILRENTFYEHVPHFKDVVDTLLRKYPGRVYDVAPTEDADHYLYGDDMRALRKVPRIRNRCFKDYMKHLEE